MEVVRLFEDGREVTGDPVLRAINVAMDAQRDYGSAVTRFYCYELASAEFQRGKIWRNLVLGYDRVFYVYSENNVAMAMAALRMLPRFPSERIVFYPSFKVAELREGHRGPPYGVATWVRDSLFVDGHFPMVSGALSPDPRVPIRLYGDDDLDDDN